MSDWLARFLAYGVPWAVLMSLPPLIGLWSIPAALGLLWIVCVISNRVQRRWRQTAHPSSTATTDYAPLRRRRLPRP